MKKFLALFCALCLIAALAGCAAADPQASPVSSAAPPVSDAVYSGTAELSYRLCGYPVSFTRADGDDETIYLTSVTLRSSCTVFTFLRDYSVAAPDFPSFTARTQDGEEYTLDPDFVGEGTVAMIGFFSSAELPVSDITELVCGDKVISLTDIESHDADISALYAKKLNELPALSWPELISYCIGSAGAYSEGAYGELARRMVEDPEEFALRLLAPAYDFGASAQNALATTDITEDFYDAYGFDAALESEICLGICTANLVPDTAKVIDTLDATGEPNMQRVAGLLSTALGSIR